MIPWSSVLPGRLTGLQLLKKFSAFYGTRRFITAFTTARHLSLSWSRSIQSMPHPTSQRFVLSCSPIYAWVYQVVSFRQVSTPNLVFTSPLPHMCYVPCPSHSSWFDHPSSIWWRVQNMKLFVLYSSLLPSYLRILRPKYESFELWKWKL
jgi:hypothetical protein